MIEKINQKEQYCPNCSYHFHFNAEDIEMEELGLISHATSWVCPKCQNTFKLNF